MSSEERSVLGFTDDFANRITANYRTAASIQNNLGAGAGAGLAAYLWHDRKNPRYSSGSVVNSSG